MDCCEQAKQQNSIELAYPESAQFFEVEIKWSGMVTHYGY